jgi:hypothetical protein
MHSVTTQTSQRNFHSARKEKREDSAQELPLENYSFAILMISKATI